MGLDWRRAKTFKPTEASIGEGFVRKDGRITPTLPRDNLAKRAAAAEAKWLKAEKLETKGARIFKKSRRRRKWRTKKPAD